MYYLFQKAEHLFFCVSAMNHNRLPGLICHFQLSNEHQHLLTQWHTVFFRRVQTALANCHYFRVALQTWIYQVLCVLRPLVGEMRMTAECKVDFFVTMLKQIFIQTPLNQTIKLTRQDNKHFLSWSHIWFCIWADHKWRRCTPRNFSCKSLW